MTHRKIEYIDEIFRLLSEQRELREDVPCSSEQVSKNQEISARIRRLVDQICVEQSTARAQVSRVRFKESGLSTGKR